MRIIALLSLLLIAPTGTVSANNDAASMDKPILSGAGRRRLMENLATLEENIRATQTNIRNSEKNMRVIEMEMKTLEGFIQEHAELRRQYNAYLSKAAEAIKRNDEQTREVATWEDMNREAATKTGQTDTLNAARVNKKERETWREDADGKVARVRALVRGLEQNLKDIESRRAPLKGQLAEWAKRQKEFQELLIKLDGKKAELEKLAQRSANIPIQDKDK